MSLPELLYVGNEPRQRFRIYNMLRKKFRVIFAESIAEADRQLAIKRRFQACIAETDVSQVLRKNKKLDHDGILFARRMQHGNIRALLILSEGWYEPEPAGIVCVGWNFTQEELLKKLRDVQVQT